MEFNYFRKLGHLNRVFKKYFLSYTPFSRLVNTSFYNHFYNKLVISKAGTILPSFLQIENTNICNAHCIMCPHDKMKRKTKIMSLENFQKIVRNVTACYPIKRVAINGFGEPLADKTFVDKILFINKNYPKIKIEFYSNASLLNDKMTNNLLRCKIEKITFSINATKKNYNKIMGLNYDIVLNNVINFIDKIKKLKHRPLVNISMVLTNENKDDVKDFVNFWRKKADSVRYYLPFNWASEIGNLGLSKNQLVKKKRWPCLILWDSVIVDADGNVIMCCADYESKVKFGNLLKEDIKQIRESDKFKELLNKQLKHDYNTPVCSGCDNIYDSSISWITE